MIFTLDIIPARKGDCLLLHFGKKNALRLGLVDGGPSAVYKPNLVPRLARIRKARAIADGKTLMIDWMMVSHIDDDHIKGILDLTTELRNAKQNGEPLAFSVKSLWHNTFDDILKTNPQELQASFGFGAASLGTQAGTGDEAESTLVLASVAQGAQLRDDAKFLGWRNAEFGNGLVIATDQPVEKPFGDLKATVIGPMKAELIALQDAHDRWLKERKANKGSAAEAALAAYVDKSVANLSSIVVLLECDAKKILMTGDARGDKILEGLELAQAVKPGRMLEVDVLKVPHHGSSNNLETNFFERIKADDYVFSGNGEHGNPERETLEMLVEARPNEAFAMHFTYPIAQIDVDRKAEWEKQQAKEKKKGGKVRANWQAQKHSLASFLKKLPKKQRIVVPPALPKPHLVELGEPLGY